MTRQNLVVRLLWGHEFVMTTIAHTGVFLTSLEIWDYSDEGLPMLARDLGNQG